METGVTGQNIQIAMLLVMVVSEYEAETVLILCQLMVATYVYFLTVKYLLEVTMKKSVYHVMNFLVTVSNSQGNSTEAAI